MSPRSATTCPACPRSCTSRSSAACSGAASARPWVFAGEDAARRLGHGRIDLGVGLDNSGARRLYERLGYTDWGHGRIVTSWREQRPDSAPVTVTETIDMLVKRL